MPTAKTTGDIVVTDSCGQAAFDAADVKVCLDPRFNTMMPIALIWLNCKYAGAGIRQLSCQGTASNEVAPGDNMMQDCVAAFSSNAFLQIMQYTMSAFEVCEQIAREHSAAALRASVTFLVKEAQTSSRLQKGARAFLQDMVDQSASLVDAEKRLEKISGEVGSASSAALASSDMLTDSLFAAFAASERNSRDMEQVGDAMRRTLSTVVDATLRLSEDFEDVIRGAEHDSALLATQGKKRASEILFAISIAVAIAVSVCDVCQKRHEIFMAAMPLSSLARFVATAVCICTFVAGKSDLFSGPQALPSFATSVALCLGLLLLDGFRIIRLLVQYFSCDPSTATTVGNSVITFVSNDNDDTGSLEGYSFQGLSENATCSQGRRLSIESACSTASVSG